MMADDGSRKSAAEVELDELKKHLVSVLADRWQSIPASELSTAVQSLTLEEVNDVLAKRYYKFHLEQLVKLCVASGFSITLTIDVAQWS